MRLEGHYRAAPVMLSGALHRPTDQVLMTAMYPIERANCKGDLLPLQLGKIGVYLQALTPKE